MMKTDEERTYYVGILVRESAILHKIIQGTKKELENELRKEYLSYSWINTGEYETGKEVKIVCSYKRLIWLREKLEWPYYKNIDVYSELTEGYSRKQSYQGELNKTSKWLDKYKDEYAYIFI